VPNWSVAERYSPEAGYLTEIITPTVDRFETLM